MSLHYLDFIVDQRKFLLTPHYLRVWRVHIDIEGKPTEDDLVVSPATPINSDYFLQSIRSNFLKLVQQTQEITTDSVVSFNQWKEWLNLDGTDVSKNELLDNIERMITTYKQHKQNKELHADISKIEAALRLIEQAKEVNRIIKQILSESIQLQGLMQSCLAKGVQYTTTATESTIFASGGAVKTKPLKSDISVLLTNLKDL